MQSYCYISFIICLLSSGDGFLEFPDFIKTVEEYKKPGDKADLIMAFRVFDPENKGYVEAEEIRDALHRLKDLSKEEIEDLLEDADLKQNRHVYFDGEFC